jgi:putative peptidoglycan lipid II flippase
MSPGDDAAASAAEQVPAGTAAAPDSRRSSALVAAGILLSRIAGLVRERAVSHFLGLGAAADAFRAAMRIPNLLQNLLGEGVLSASFIPVYAQLLGDDADDDDDGRTRAERERAAGEVAGAVAGVLAALAGALVVIGVVFARPIAVVLTPGFTDERLELTVTLLRILTPGVGFLVLSAWCLGILNSHRRFFLSYVAPVVWNVAQIAAVVAAGIAGFGQRSLATSLAWGAFAGGILQLGVQLPAVRRVAGTVRLSLRVGLPGVREVGRRFVPVVAGRGVVQLAGWLDMMLASLLAVGALAALTAAQVFYLLPISLFAMSVAAAELPELSRAAGGHHEPALLARLEAGLARIVFFVAPTIAAYLVAGDLVVGAVLQSGRFGGDESRLVWYVLAAYSLGLLATTGSRLLQNALYAGGDAKGPALFAAVRVGLAAVVGVVLMFQLDRVVLDGPGLGGLDGLDRLGVFDWGPLPQAVREAGPLRLGAVGLALASAVGAWVELALLRRRVARRFGPTRLGGGQLGGAVAASAVAAAVAIAVRLALPALPPLLAGPIVLGVFGVVYLTAARRLGIPEAATLVATARRTVHRR